MITIGIVDNDRFALNLLAQTVGRLSPDFRVLWSASAGAQAVHRCLYAGQCPDVLLLDMSLTDMPGADVCAQIRRERDDVAVLGITSYAIAHYREAAVEAGMQMLIGKESTPRELGEAIRAVAAGRTGEGFHSAPDAHRALADDAGIHIEDVLASLSRREREVLRLYAEDLDTEAIAERLGVAAGTVYVVVRHIKAKLGVATRAEALRLARARLDRTGGLD